MLSLSPVDALIAVAIVTVGATVQASVGFGLALIAAPLLIVIDHAFVPGPMLATAVVLAVLVAYRERTSIDLDGLKYALAGRVVGTLPAVAAVGALSQSAYDTLFAALVLVAVILSATHGSLRPTPRHVSLAGALSGFVGTISSIGGPPMALVYQDADGPRIRATLSAFFVVGSSLSIVLLAFVGRFGRAELELAAILAPGAVVGFVLSRGAVRFLDRGSTRPLVLALSAASAGFVLIRAFTRA